MQIRTFGLGEDFVEIRKMISDFWQWSREYTPVWQQIDWIEMLLQGWALEQAYFLGDVRDGKILGYVLIEKRSIGLGKYGFFCIGGPNITSDCDQETFETAMQDLVRKEGGVFLQIEPIHELTLQEGKYGYYKGFIESHTLLIDLTQDEDAILAQMHQKGRYNIKLAQKHEVTVTRSEGDTADLDAFMQLLHETLERDGFAGNSRAYYEALLSARTGAHEWLYLAKKDGEVIAAAILVIQDATALYYYGASTSDNAKRKFMPAYLLQWEMMRASKAAGCSVYDFLGIAPAGALAHRLEWVSDFKRKFGGREFEFPKKRIYVIQGMTYVLLEIMRSLKRIIRR